MSKKQEVTLEGVVYTPTTEFKVGRKQFDNLADELFAGGMPYLTALDEAFDFFLRSANLAYFRMGDVMLTPDFAYANCVAVDA